MLFSIPSCQYSLDLCTRLTQCTKAEGAPLLIFLLFTALSTVQVTFPIKSANMILHLRHV